MDFLGVVVICEHSLIKFRYCLIMRDRFYFCLKIGFLGGRHLWTLLNEILVFTLLRDYLIMRDTFYFGQWWIILVNLNIELYFLKMSFVDGL